MVEDDLLGGGGPRDFHDVFAVQLQIGKACLLVIIEFYGDHMLRTYE